jgi:hypothetical protein
MHRRRWAFFAVCLVFMMHLCYSENNAAFAAAEKIKAVPNNLLPEVWEQLPKNGTRPA